VPLYENHRFKVCFTYGLEKTKNEPDEDRIISCDLGMKNLMTFYNPNGYQYIIRGNVIKSINCYYNMKINKLKSELATAGSYKQRTDRYKRYLAKGENYVERKYLNPNCVPIRMTRKNPDYIRVQNQINCVRSDTYIDYNEKKQLTSKGIRNLLIKRDNKINSYFDKIVRWITKNFSDCSKIIVGYNKSWKTGVNMGRKTNGRFYQIPYRRLLSKLRDTLKKNNQELIETEESYTSKCDALSLESVSKHKKYMGERTKRGLFASKTGVLINADLNGAINIMRKWKKERKSRWMK
jgi:IS605 OrfB family transposase